MAVAAKVLDMGISTDPIVVYLTDLENTGINDIVQGPCTLYGIVVDNTGNAEAEYLKIYDSKAPTYGTTEPDYVFPITASKPILIPVGLPSGISLTNGLSCACAQEAGADCTTVPTASVNVTFWVVPA